MKSALPGLLVLAALLVVPFWLRSEPPAPSQSGRKLTILTPHNEAIRFEMTRGFRRYLRQKGEPDAELDWRSPGGTTELSRYMVSEYRAAFARYYERKTGTALSERAAQAFQNNKQRASGSDEAARARALFLSSNVGIGIDLLFGGGSFDFGVHAAAGRLVDAGIVKSHPELFGPAGIPEQLGGEPYWDRQGRWIGACVSGFGICYNPEALAKLGITRAPKAWGDLADPRLAGHVALADPSKSGSANKAFEMIVQREMAAEVSRAGQPASGSDAEAAALGRGFDAGMRLIRHIGGVARYFSDQAPKVAQDVQSGSAAAGMCIDFYGRFESDVPGPGARLRFALAEGGSSLGSDPIGMLRGAPHEALAKSFIEFVLSPAGQQLWAYRVGTPGGPERYALRRTPILPVLFEPERRALRSDPEDNPYAAEHQLSYHASWTGPLFRALSLVIRLSCVDMEDELHEAWTELHRHHEPPQAQALFDDVTLISYQVIKSEIAPTLASGDPLREVALQNRLLEQLLAQYRRVAELARSEQ